MDLKVGEKSRGKVGLALVAWVGDRWIRGDKTPQLPRRQAGVRLLSAVFSLGPRGLKDMLQDRMGFTKSEHRAFNTSLISTTCTTQTILSSP